MLGDPKTTLKVMVINFIIPSLILSMKMANFALSGPICKIQNFK